MPTRRHQKGQIGAYHSWREEADPLFPPFPPFPDEPIVGPNALQDPMYAIVEKEYIYAGPFRLVQEMFPASITLESVATVGGRIVKNGNNLQPRYFITDHLGSTRVVLDNFGSVLERYDYYPYGKIVPVSVASSGNTDYLYTGKEFQKSLFGINWYDSGARFQTTDGIFTSIDPLAEKYYHISPYAYCAGNPVRFADYDGADRKDKAIGIAIGVVTNVIPFSTGLRDFYTPTDPADYNGTLMAIDAAAMSIGESLTKGGATVAVAGAGAMAVGGITIVASGGVAALEGAAVAVVGQQALVLGTATAMTGASLMKKAGNNKSAGYEYGKETGTNNATKTNSTTLWKGKGKDSGQIDVEVPGTRQGQIHYQDKTGKYVYKDGKFYAKNPKTKEYTDLAPKRINKKLSNPEIQRAIEKGNRYLGE